MNQEHIKKVETMEKAMKPRMTAVFECDLQKFEGNPHLQDTPFGRAVTLALGDALDADGLPPRVKPLDWRFNETVGFHHADTYRVRKLGPKWVLSVTNAIQGLVTHFPTLEAAKAAAWADYEARILSALEGYNPRNPA